MVSAEEFYARVLADLPCPACQPPYNGAADSYITFSVVERGYARYASGEPRRMAHTVQVMACTRLDGGEHVELLDQAVALLRAAGVKIRMFGADIYEPPEAGGSGLHWTAATTEYITRLED